MWVAAQNAKREAEYEKMFLDAEAKRNAEILEENSNKIANEAVEVVQENASGINQPSESFNQEQLSWLRAHNFIKDKNILEYPKLFADTHGKIEIPLDILSKNQIEYLVSSGYKIEGDLITKDVSKSLPKSEKALKKLMKQLDSEHRARRIEDARHRIGNGNDSVLYNPIIVPEERKYSFKKYKAMENERLTDDDWKPEMTREEFMQNRDKYIMEEFERTRIKHRTQEHKKTFWEKLKSKIGL